MTGSPRRPQDKCRILTLAPSLRVGTPLPAALQPALRLREISHYHEVLIQQSTSLCIAPWLYLTVYHIEH